MSRLDSCEWIKIFYPSSTLCGYGKSVGHYGMTATGLLVVVFFHYDGISFLCVLGEFIVQGLETRLLKPLERSDDSYIFVRVPCTHISSMRTHIVV